jgi:hypothetical protein
MWWGGTIKGTQISAFKGRSRKEKASAIGDFLESLGGTAMRLV